MTTLLSERTERPKGRLVALPDAPANGNDSAPSRTPYRIGLEASEPGSQFELGAMGPGNQNLPWIYATAGPAVKYEINLQDNILTVLIIDEATGNVRAVHYPISAQDMIGQTIEVGEPISVIFAFDEELFLDETPEIDSWCAASGPRYFEELTSHTKNESATVQIFRNQLESAKSVGHEHFAKRPPKSAKSLSELEREQKEEALDDPELAHEPDIAFDASLPAGVQIIDPVTGKTFVGRRWIKPHESTTVNALVAGGYRLAVIRFQNGDVATLMPNFTGKQLGVQIRTKTGLVGRVLHEEAAEEEIGPGKRLCAEIDRSLDGDKSLRGELFKSPPIVVVVGVGPEIEQGIESDLPVDHTLAAFRAPNRYAVQQPRTSHQELGISLRRIDHHNRAPSRR